MSMKACGGIDKLWKNAGDLWLTAGVGGRAGGRIPCALTGGTYRKGTQEVWLCTYRGRGCALTGGAAVHLQGAHTARVHRKCAMRPYRRRLAVHLQEVYTARVHRKCGCALTGSCRACVVHFRCEQRMQYLRQLMLDHFRRRARLENLCQTWDLVFASPHCPAAARHLPWALVPGSARMVVVQDDLRRSSKFWRKN